MKLHTFAVLSLSVVAAVGFSLPASAGTQASIKIEQLSASQFGSWTLLSQDGTTKSSEDEGIDFKDYSFGLTDFGQTTLSVKAPNGMSVKISVYRGGELIKEIEGVQYSFPILANDNYRFVIRYALTKLGSLGVTSDPNRLRFRMKATRGRTYTAVTPHTFTNIPAGKYSLYFPATDDCYRPAVQTVKVEPEQRNTTVVTLTCDIHESGSLIDTSRISKRSIREYVEQREVKTRGNRK